MDYNIKKRMNIDILYYKCTGMSKTGAKEYADPINLKCYRIGCIVKHYNTKGEELVSQNIFYFEATVDASQMTNADMLVYDNHKMPIVKVAKYYTTYLDMLEVFA